MKHVTSTIAGFAVLAAALPQGVTQAIAPFNAPVCAPDYSGTFQISVVNASTTTTSAQLVKRQSGALMLSLAGGVLKDAQGRTGYIASNRQFQFDNPPQAGAIFTSGFSVCGNGSLALASAVWYECYSGGFFNLYDRPAESDCSPVYLDAFSSGTGNGVVSTMPSSVAPVSQIGDGQPQASSAVVAPVTQIGDGQIQGPTATQIAPVTQIGDGQIQAPTSTAIPIAPVTQIHDGQIQAPTTTIAAVTQIHDGQIQAPTNGTVPIPFTGAAGPTILEGDSVLGLVALSCAILVGAMVL